MKEQRGVCPIKRFKCLMRIREDDISIPDRKKLDMQDILLKPI